MSRITKTNDWKDFEYSTKRELEALGYKVQHDVLMAGSQIDLYAELHQPLQTHRLLVECKDEKSPVGVDNARRLSALINSLSKPFAPLYGMIVARNGFTKEAKAFAQTCGLWLLTAEELARMTFDPMPLIDATIESFESDRLGSTYIDLTCRVKESSGTIYKPVERFLDEFLAKTKRAGVAILGNFGTGKTSLCRHYAYLLAKRWKEGRDLAAELPVYVNLRDVRTFEQLDETIVRVAKPSCANSSLSGMKNWLMYGKTLLLLDGFDEMASKMNRIEIASNLGMMRSFCEQNPVHVILTCRTHFFRDQIEERALGNMLRLYICDWGKTELMEYVSRTTPEKSADAVEEIRKTYNLEELSKTPLFLEMIVSSINKIGGRINQAKLYQIYTDRWIDNQRNRSLLTPEDKRRFMEELAYTMFEAKMPDLSYDDLPSRIGDFFSLKDYQALRLFDQDVRTCSFLVRDDNGRYRFVHKSYMEFFAASHLAAQVKEKRLERFGSVLLTKEIAGFFANYFETDADVIMDLLVRSENPQIRANAAMALACLLFTEKIQSSLLLALEIEREDIVLRPVIDSLFAIGTHLAVEHILKAARRIPSCAVQCVRGLAPHINRDGVVHLLDEILNSSENVDLVIATLETIERSGNRILSDSVHAFVKKKWWLADVQVVAAVLRVIDSLGTLELARDLGRLADRHMFDDKEADNSQKVENHNKALFTYVWESLRKRFSPDIRMLAKGNHAQGLTYSQNEGTVRGQFGRFVDDEALQALLQKLYNMTQKGKKSKRAPRMRKIDQRRTTSRNR